ncbi:MAG: gfo/Idh/MocA family oxidoreductase [Chloroflexi bacterium]|nr:gfo/Idh/MocA family oxidoreductase [Chloroflexota bacterium]
MSIRFAAIGLSHNHVFGQVNVLLKAGAELVWFWGEEPERVVEFGERFPQAKQARSIDEILDDPTIDLVVSAPIPRERAALGVRVMQHGKDFLTAKPAFTSLEQLAEARRVQAETGRIFDVFFAERLDNPSTVKAAELARSGAIGQVIQTVGFGPHKLLNHGYRPDWSFDIQYYGGILNDLASHQIDQFLYFTQSTSAEIVQAQVGNFRFHQFANFEDFGDFNIRSDRATGYVRVDWLTPEGLGVWGDVRLFVQGTEGYIELRKNIDIAGRAGTNHLFMVDQHETRYIDCSGLHLPFAEQLIADVQNRTETAISQAHVFLTCELILKAQEMAKKITEAV